MCWLHWLGVSHLLSKAAPHTPVWPGDSHLLSDAGLQLLLCGKRGLPRCPSHLLHSSGLGLRCRPWHRRRRLRTGLCWVHTSGRAHPLLLLLLLLGWLEGRHSLSSWGRGRRVIWGQWGLLLNEWGSLLRWQRRLLLLCVLHRALRQVHRYNGTKLWLLHLRLPTRLRTTLALPSTLQDTLSAPQTARA